MGFIFILLPVLIVVFIGLMAVMSTLSNPSANIKIDVNYIGDRIMYLPKRKGYIRQSIVGMYFRDLSKVNIGEFEGVAIAVSDNKFDKYAIEIWDSESNHLGFAPGGNRELHAYILSQGGIVDAYGYVALDGSDTHNGMVGIKDGK